MRCLSAGVQYHAVVHYPLVDVRDTAYAHIYAFEVPTANGRNLLVNRVIRSCEILEILRQHYPTLDLPQKYVLLTLFYYYYLSIFVCTHIFHTFSCISTICWDTSSKNKISRSNI